MNQPGAPEPALSLSKGPAFFETWEDCLGPPPAPGEVNSPTERMEGSPAEAPRDDNSSRSDTSRLPRSKGARPGPPAKLSAGGA